MKRDNIIFDIIEKEHQRQLKGIELIASENFVSDQVMQAMGSCLTNKYAEGYPGKRYYGGCEVVDQSETIAIERLKQIFNAEWANVQPHSGAQANAAVFLAVLNPGDTFLGLNLAHGGHLSHGSPVNSSGILYHATEYNVKEDTGRVDYDQMEEVALREKPKLIVGGGSAYSREWDYKRMREIADKVGALLMIDMAHPAGLIAAGLLNNPLEYAHIVTSTTHKTLRGPRGGIILLGKDFENPWGKKTPKGEIKKMSQLLDSAVFPGIQGGPLEHVIAAKAVAFGEALEPEYLPGSGKSQCGCYGKSIHGQRLQDHLRRYGQPQHVDRPAQEVPRTDRQGGRKGIGSRRYHRKQEYGSVRQPFGIPDFRHPCRNSGYHDPRR